MASRRRSAEAAAKKKILSSIKSRAGMKPCGRSPRNPCPMRNLERIKYNAVTRGYSYKPLWIKDGGRDALVFPKKYSYGWWKKAKKSDVRRVMVR